MTQLSLQKVNEVNGDAGVMTNEVPTPIEEKSMPQEPIAATCPGCGSKALYKYGRIRNRQRFLCLLCGRQFINGFERPYPGERPTCALCGKKMYVYAKGAGFTRYRCSDYPTCRGHLKINTNDIIREEKEE